MEIDSGNRKPDSDKEPNNMETSIDVNPIKHLHESNGEQPEQGVEQTNVRDPNLAPVLEHPEKGDDRVTNQEQTAPSPFKLRYTQDLLSLYGLQPLVASVARVDPVTGEKINKLRKSYEGLLKPLGLSGKNERYTAKEGNRLMEMVMWPEEEYYNQRVHGKDVRNGLPAGTLAKLEKAMHMRPGPVPENHKWEEIFGFDRSKPVGAPVDKKGKAGPQTNGQVNGNRITGAAESDDTRPKRAGKKRRYNDDSFEGYAEGFVDDADDMVGGGDGYSSEEHSRRGSASKRRKKVDF